MEKGFVIVTGGTRGIGKAITNLLLVQGYGVVAVYKNDVGFDLRPVVGRLIIKKCDISDEEQRKSLFEELGNLQLNIIGLVNNAGVYPKEETQEEYLGAFATNVIAPYLLTKMLIEYRARWRLSGFGVVVNIGSTSALTGPTGSPMYASTKAAFSRLSEIAASQFALELRINTVHPGAVNTGMLLRVQESAQRYISQTPTRRITEPEEIARAVLFFFENPDLNMTGGSIIIDGGRTHDYRERQ
ncbi:SDR family NAD(P)-dependent oxidoreductase [Patescibacteria group bacterium]